MTHRHGTAERWTPLEDVLPKDVFKAEVAAWAKRIGVTLKEFHVRPRKRKWGSCSSLGQARFSTDLLAQPAQFRHEAIVHELLHLKVPNQRKSFRSLLKAYLGHVATQTLPHRIRRQDGDEESTLARQARFLEQLKAMQSVAMYSGRSIHA